MKVIVLGASGFIGLYLVNGLRALGHDPIPTGRNRAAALYYKKLGLEMVHVDVTNPGDFEKLPSDGVDAVVHLVGLMPSNMYVGKPQDYMKINAIGMLNVLDYCRATGVSTLITTTSYADVQESWSVDPPTPDDAPRRYRYVGDHAMYVISKVAATDSVLHFNAVYGLSGAIFRLPAVYGYGPHLTIFKEGVLQKSGFQVFMEKARDGSPIEVWGDPSTVRDVVYVKDVVQAFVKALERKNVAGIYNIASGVPLTLKRQAEAMIEVFGSKSNRSELKLLPQKDNGLESYVFSVEKADRDFGYKPEYSFLEMLVDYKREESSGWLSEFILSRAKTGSQ